MNSCIWWCAKCVCFRLFRALNVILVFNTEGQRFLRVGLAVPLFGSISTLRAMVAEEGNISPEQVRPDVCLLILSLSPSLCHIFLFLNLIVCNTHSLLYCIVMHTHTLHIVLPKKNSSCINLPGSQIVIVNKCSIHTPLNCLLWIHSICWLMETSQTCSARAQGVIVLQDTHF